MITGLCFVASASFGQDLKGEVQSVPYDLLAQHATERIDFEEFNDWREAPDEISGALHAGSASLSPVFQGQYVFRSITGTSATAPLELAPNFRSPIGALTGGVKHIAVNLLDGFEDASGNNLLSTTSISGINQGGARSRSVILGIDPISILFETDQSAVGFSFFLLNRASQAQFVSRTGSPRFRIKFFHRDGMMISEIIMTPDRNKSVAFARCGGAVDIAGIQITNSTRSGLAFDNFIFGMPVSAPAPASEALNTMPSDQDEVSPNPLEVDLCSVYIS